MEPTPTFITHYYYHFTKKVFDKENAFKISTTTISKILTWHKTTFWWFKKLDIVKVFLLSVYVVVYIDKTTFKTYSTNNPKEKKWLIVLKRKKFRLVLKLVKRQSNSLYFGLFIDKTKEQIKIKEQNDSTNELSTTHPHPRVCQSFCTNNK